MSPLAQPGHQWAFPGHQQDDGLQRQRNGHDLQPAGVEGDGEVAQDLWVIAPGEQGPDDDQSGAGQAQRQGLGAVFSHNGWGKVDHARSTAFSPNRPCGRNTRTRMSRTKAQTSFQGLPPNWPGMYWVAIASTMPRSRPPTTAPATLPMPPRTAATNALRPARKPIRKLMLWFCRPWATPATAARTAPSANATTMIRSTLMPIRRAVSWSWETACIPWPILVWLMKYHSRAEQTMRAPMVKIASRAMVTPPICIADPVTTSISGNGMIDFASGRLKGFQLVNGTLL